MQTQQQNYYERLHYEQPPDEIEELLKKHDEIERAFDWDNPICPRNLSTCQQTLHDEYFECSCGFQIFKPWSGSVKVKTLCEGCRRPMTKSAWSKSVTCPDCVRKRARECRLGKKRGHYSKQNKGVNKRAC